MKSNLRRAAFTLTEVIVVLGIAAVLSGGVWGILAGSNRSFEDSSAHMSAMRSAVTALEWVRKDLARMAVPRPRPPFTDLPQPVRILAGGEFCILVTKAMDTASLGADLSVLPTTEIHYKFVPRGEPGEGFYRNGQRMAGIMLDRFELARFDDPASGAPMLRLAVTGADPSGRRTIFLHDIVYLEQIDTIRRHPASPPNPVPAVEVQPDPTAGVL